jgi:3-phenylpropionate/cinnamic acid dioxygenase small subunit
VAEIPSTDPRYAEVLQFLYHEAELLDTDRQVEWLELLTDDITYRMPVRLNVRRNASAPYAQETDIFSDNLASLRVRVNKLDTEYAWAETPPSRTRHHVSNVRVSENGSPGELDVRSYILVYRNRTDNPAADIFSGERQDVLRKVDGGWRLARRLIVLDQAVVGARHLAILL